jgi:hypothetical protein
MDPGQKLEWLTCAESPVYFIHTYCQIYDATERAWIPFHLWREQATTLMEITANRLVVILKARQLGLTWLALGFVLWLMLFRAPSVSLLFSRRDDEAIYLLGQERLRGMYQRLPEWMKARRVTDNNDHEWILSNGSVARAFPTTAGDSYTATAVVVDEADLVPDLGKVLNAVKPTIDAGGWMILLSRTDNSKPESEFKQIYRAAKKGTTSWKAVFLPWSVRPDRDGAWYERQKADVLARTGSLDDLYQQYPSTDTEALSPRTLDKRIAPEWLRQCYEEIDPHPTLSQGARDVGKAPAIPGLRLYVEPGAGRRYVIGVDPAEGNPTSDDSALTVLDAESGEEAASLAGKFQPAMIAAHADEIGRYFNRAGLMVERNNHGHAVLLWLRDHSSLSILNGYDGKGGWLSNSKGKALLYTTCADAFREKTTKCHTFETFVQLSSIDGSTLLAPEGQHDDLADSYALALCGASKGGKVETMANPFF